MSRDVDEFKTYGRTIEDELMFICFAMGDTSDCVTCY